LAKQIKLLILDLDDTLISTHPLYEARRHAFAAKMERYLGVEYEEAYETLVKIDKASIPSLGVGLDRFPLSFSHTYKSLCEKHGFEHDVHFDRELQAIAESVFIARSIVYPYTPRILIQLIQQGYELCILTRGDRSVQLRRVIESNLASYFSNVFVVDKKTDIQFKRICQFYDVNIGEAVMIGNSMYGDILPALEAGLFAILIPNGTKEIEDVLQSPSPENNYPDHLFRGTNLTDVPDILTRINT